jgi:DNA gyrase subunit A
VTALVVSKEAFGAGHFLVMATSMGQVKMTALEKFANVRASGLIAMKLKVNEDLVAACMVTIDDKALLVSQNGKAIRFAVKDLRIASRTSGGVRGIRLDKGDHLVFMGKEFPKAKLLTVTENGFGKLTKVENYPLQLRGGKGVISQKVNFKTGKVISAYFVQNNQHLFIITAKGIVIRISIDDEIPVQGRDTQGVHLNRLDEEDSVSSIACSDVVMEGAEEEKTAETK